MSDQNKSKQGKDSVMDDAVLADHDFDGITEYDNPLPNWWLTTFYGAIIFSMFYFSYYQMGSGPTLVDEFDKDFASKEFNQLALRAKKKLPDEAAMVAFFKDPAKKAKGKELFKTRCVTCHGDNAQGNIGPNLTDDFWLHGCKLTDIMKTVNEGVLEKGMPAWGMILEDDELVGATVFVKSLKGSNPANPKAPQGTLCKE